MKLPTSFSAVILFPLVLLSGCSAVSKFTSGIAEKRKASSTANNPEQMRVSSQGAVFQPVARVEIPQYQGLQTPMVSGRTQRFSSTARTINLPHFTPVKVLSTNARVAFVELGSGQRGFLAKDAIASESTILAGARTATPVYTAATGPEPLPQMDFSDVPVDQAMLNNIDNIPLPESETPVPALAPAEEFETVEGVLVRKPKVAVAPAPAPESVPEPEASPLP